MFCSGLDWRFEIQSNPEQNQTQAWILQRKWQGRWSQETLRTRSCCYGKKLMKNALKTDKGCKIQVEPVLKIRNKEKGLFL